MTVRPLMGTDEGRDEGGVVNDVAWSFSPSGTSFPHSDRGSGRGSHRPQSRYANCEAFGDRYTPIRQAPASLVGTVSGTPLVLPRTVTRLLPN
jgi:hypothetical protein